uniref:Adaptin N terminal region family protein n=1 Tax=Coptotermes formosanus TaxID=36987 RepID=R4V279_COPFO|nr:adaptin N terminal region family protein [Coptotermes formosanus]
MKISILNSLAKLLFVSPGEARPVLASCLNQALNDSHPLVVERAKFIYQLLKTNLNAARVALVTNKHCETEFNEDQDDENFDLIFDEFNTFSVIYEKPQIVWDAKPEEINLRPEVEEEEAAEEETGEKLEDLIEISPQKFQENWTNPLMKVVTEIIDLGFEIELGQFVEVVQEANLGVIAQGSSEEGSKVYAYGYTQGELGLIESIEVSGTLTITVKSLKEEVAEAIKSFWIRFFNQESS